MGTGCLSCTCMSKPKKVPINPSEQLDKKSLGKSMRAGKAPSNKERVDEAPPLNKNEGPAEVNDIRLDLRDESQPPA